MATYKTYQLIIVMSHDKYYVNEDTIEEFAVSRAEWIAEHGYLYKGMSSLGDLPVTTYLSPNSIIRIDIEEKGTIELDMTHCGAK